MSPSKLQFLYIPRHVAAYMRNVHQDDKKEGSVARLYDHPTESANQALLVLPPHTKDLSVDVVLEEARRIGDLGVSPIVVSYDGADNAMWVTQDDDMIKVRTTDHAVEIAMRLLLWASLEQEKTNGLN